MAWPVAGNITQYFSAGHMALDIGAPCGTSVGAAREGTVVYAGWKENGGGNVVDIDHGDGAVTSYNHLALISVAPGQWVSRSQTIGTVGTTGISTGCHLHLALLIDGVWMDPLAYL